MVASQLEWRPFDLPEGQTDFIDGVNTLGGNGDANLRDGIALHIFTVNSKMDHRAIANADGEALIVAQLGNLDIQTELGKLYLQPGEICIIPRGIRHCINPAEGTREARGYIVEVFGSRWQLPELGPIGSHGLANKRDFLTPVAFIDEKLHEPWQIFTKINGAYNVRSQDHSPFDVAAWQGNCVPYKVFSIPSSFSGAQLFICSPTVRHDEVRLGKLGLS